MGRPQDDHVRYTIRVPVELYAKLRSSAGQASINAEIITRLAASFELDDEFESLEERVSDLERNTADAERENDKRFDRLEANIYRLLEHAGLYDPNPEK